MVVHFLAYQPQILVILCADLLIFSMTADNQQISDEYMTV